MRRARSRLLALVAAAAVVAAGAAWAWPDRRPNVLWITVDGLRADRLSAYGYAANATPAMDSLARTGVSFTQAFSDAPWSGAAAASAMTGRLAAHHGLRSPYRRLDERSATLAEVLRDQGYDTAAIVGSFSLDHVYGLDRGFARYDDRFDSAEDGAAMRPRLPSAFHANANVQRTYLARKRRADSWRSDQAVADAAVAWVKRASRMRPFFLWVHFFGPRARRKGAETPAQVTARTLQDYDQQVAEVDAQIGRLLGELEADGIAERTIVVLQGTYGESLSPDGILSRGTRLGDTALRVPLLIRWPARIAPARVAAVVRSIDVAPTLLDLLGLPPLPQADGESLRGPLLAGGAGERPAALAETWLSAEGDLGMFNTDGTAALPGLWRRSARTDHWKYVRSDPVPFVNFSPPPALPADAERYRGEQLYDIAADPAETTDVAAAHTDVTAELRRRVETMPPLGGPAAGAAD